MVAKTAVAKLGGSWNTLVQVAGRLITTRCGRLRHVAINPARAGPINSRCRRVRWAAVRLGMLGTRWRAALPSPSAVGALLATPRGRVGAPQSPSPTAKPVSTAAMRLRTRSTAIAFHG
jgi:hypothetical protein